MFKVKHALLTGWLIAAVGLAAQTLKIDDCYRLAKENFPLVKQCFVFRIPDRCCTCYCGD